MPRLACSDEFLAGRLAGLISELQRNLDLLTSSRRMSKDELSNMRYLINNLDANWEGQCKDIGDRRWKPKEAIYKSIRDLTIAEIERRERHSGEKPPESEAMRARRLRQHDNLDGYASDGKGPVPLEYWTAVLCASGNRITVEGCSRFASSNQ